MKLTDIYPGITTKDFKFELSNADVVIEKEEYRLARIYREADDKFPDFSYDVVYPRRKRPRTLNIDEIVFVPDDFINHPVDWRIVESCDDDISNNIFHRELYYNIFRNGKYFYGGFATKNEAETFLQMIFNHPFDFNMIEWEEMITKCPVKFLSYDARIKSVYHDLSCLLELPANILYAAPPNGFLNIKNQIEWIKEIVYKGNGTDNSFKFIFDINYSELWSKKAVTLSLFSPFISWTDSDYFEK